MKIFFFLNQYRPEVDIAKMELNFLDFRIIFIIR